MDEYILVFSISFCEFYVFVCVCVCLYVYFSEIRISKKQWSTGITGIRQCKINQFTSPIVMNKITILEDKNMG